MKYLFGFLLLPVMVFAQDFSGEDYIYLKRHEHIKIELNDHNFNIIQNTSEQGEFLTSKNLYYANKSIGYSGFSEIKDISAFTYIPETDKTIEVDHIETKQRLDDMVFYSDDEFKEFTFPAVTRGAITNLSYKRVIKEPKFLGAFNFGTYVPTRNAQFSIEFPKNVTIGYVEFNTDNITVDFKKEETNTGILYTWTTSNTEGYESEEDSEAVLYHLPHIVPYIKSYDLNGKSYNVLNNVQDLYRWYTTFIDRIEEEPLDKVYAKAMELTKSLDSDFEKAEKIFNWVQNNINYIAFGDGYQGFVPSGAASVSENRYGDCKAMSNLLYEMLNHVGIEAYRTWIGTRRRPYSYFDVPTATVDDHMITTAIIDQDTIFLDATDSYVPFGMPSAFTQSKEAMLSLDKETFKIIDVPIQNAEKSQSVVNSDITLDGGVVRVSEKRTLTGYEKVDFIDKYRIEKDDQTEEEFLNTTLALGNNKTKYSHINKENFDNKRTPLLLSYDLEIDNYAKIVGDKTYINLNIDRTLSKSKIDIEGRRYSKKIDNKFVRKYTTTFTLPAGYKLSQVPEDLAYEKPEFGFKISYSQNGNSLTQAKTIYVNTLSIKQEGFEAWNDFIKSLTKAYKKSITIEKDS
jgi:hypothetical protein